MPKLNHDTLGNISKYVYLPGKILDIDWDADTAKVEFRSDLSPHGEVWENVPIFYHCFNDVKELENGSLEGASDGFNKNDYVILMCELAEQKATLEDAETQFENIKIIGHEEGPKKCCLSWVLTFCWVDVKEEEEEEEEVWVTIYDIKRDKIVDTLMKPKEDEDEEDEFYIFPCRFEDFEPWLSKQVPSVEVESNKSPVRPPDGEEDEIYAYQWPSIPLYEFVPCDTSYELQVAGGTPNWMDDFQGNTIRGEASPEDWWSTYNFMGNPTFKHFWDIQINMLLKRWDKVDELAEQFDEYEWEGPGVRSDHREFKLTDALSIDEEELTATSTHHQVGYGEDEIWVCGRNTWQGLIVSWCDDMSKFIRMESFPPVIMNKNLALDRLIGKAPFAVLGAGAGARPALNEVGMAIAADVFTGFGGIFVHASLKRINEGMYHRDIYPAIDGSFLLWTVRNPALEYEPLHRTSLNIRRDNANTWVRFDNWHNTLGYSHSVHEANRTWWFRVWSTQSAVDAVWWDTPIGEMLFRIPHERHVLWQSFGLSNGNITVRQDWPIRTRHFAFGEQHQQSAFQAYIIWRQGIKLDGKPEDVESPYFFRQFAIEEPWNCLPKLQDIEPIEDRESDLLLTDHYVGFIDEQHITEMTDDEIWEEIEELEFVLRESDDSEEYEKRVRKLNEIEVLAAADMWGDLYDRKENHNPRHQEVKKGLAESVKGVIEKALEDVEESFPEIKMEMRLL